jgi:hypothetical protein
LEKTMTVTLKSIEQNSATDDRKSFVVGITIDSQDFQFNLSIDPGGIYLREQELQVISGDDAFTQMFRHNSRIATKIGRLVANWAEGENLDLPIDLGTMDRPETRK